MTEFRGVYPALITPMTRDGKLNESAFREIIEFNIKSGVHGFWMAGGTGESVLLDDEENMLISEISSDQARGRVKNIMHVGAPTTPRAMKLASHAARVGVDAICCVPPFFYSPSDEAVIVHYKAVAEAAELPFFVYNLPSATGVEITPNLMLKIKDRVPQLRGLKHSAMNLSNIRVFAKMDLECFIGNSMLMLPALTIGATGCVDGPLCVAPELWLEIWDAFNKRDLKRAEIAQEKATTLTELLVGEFGYFAVIKEVMGERLGIDCGDPRPPILPLSDQQRKYVLKRAAELGVAKAAFTSDKN